MGSKYKDGRFDPEEKKVMRQLAKGQESHQELSEARDSLPWSQSSVTMLFIVPFRSGA